MPSGPAMSMMARVIWISACDGVGSPEGWLCTSRIAVADNSSARFITSRGYRRVVDGANLLHLVRYQLVALVEKQDAKLLLVGERHAGAAIVDHVIPGRQHRALLQLALGDAARRRRDQFELVDRSVADAVDFAQPRHRRVNDFRERAECPEQRLCQRLGV